ncbi:MAG: hypothetical protein H0X40_08175 [Chthoniobacterales bacterium]|nr:hypothetical protein [Chthoniobacterales bacterium]
MKPAWLTPLMLREFQQLQLIGLLVAGLALIPFLALDFVASLAETKTEGGGELYDIGNRHAPYQCLTSKALFSAKTD